MWILWFKGFKAMLLIAMGKGRTVRGISRGDSRLPFQVWPITTFWFIIEDFHITLHLKSRSYDSKNFPKTTALVHKLIEVDEIAPVKQAETYLFLHSLSVAPGVRMAAGALPSGWSPGGKKPLESKKAERGYCHRQEAGPAPLSN